MERFRTLGGEYSESLSMAKKRSIANEIILDFPIVQPVAVSRSFTILTGIPGSGKSTISSFLNQQYGFNAVATDKIKAYLQESGWAFAKPDLFHIQAMIFKYHFVNDLNVISDSNSGSSKHRYKLRKMGERYNYKVVNINVVCDPEMCLKRVVARNGIIDSELIERWRRKIYESDTEIQVPRSAFTVDTAGDLNKVQAQLLAIYEEASK